MSNNLISHHHRSLLAQAIANMLRRRKALRIIANVLLVALVCTNFQTRVQASDNNVFKDIKPNLVFALSLQLDNGADYHQYVYVDDQQGFCDLSRPVNSRECQIDLIRIIHQFKRVAVIRHAAVLPTSVQWNAWDWDTMTLREGGYTPVVMAAEIREWESESDEVHHWWVACSVIPDTPTLAVCREADIVDPTADVIVSETTTISSLKDYVIVGADELLAISDVVGAQTANDPSEETNASIGDLMDQVYG